MAKPLTKEQLDQKALEAKNGLQEAIGASKAADTEARRARVLKEKASMEFDRVVNLFRQRGLPLPRFTQDAAGRFHLAEAPANE